MTAEQLWWTWYGRDWREDAQKYALPPEPEPEPELERATIDDWDELEWLYLLEDDH